MNESPESSRSTVGCNVPVLRGHTVMSLKKMTSPGDSMTNY